MFLILFFSTSISSSLHVTISRILMPQRTQTNKQTQFKCGPCYGYSMIFVVVFIAINSDRLSTISTDHHLSISNTQQTLILRFSMFFFVFYSTLLRTCTALSTHTTHHSKYTPYTYFVFSSSYSFVLCIFCVCLLSTIYFFHCMFVHWNHEFVGSGRPSFTRSHINSCLSMVLWHSSVVIRCVKSNLLLLRFKLAAHTQY